MRAEWRSSCQLAKEQTSGSHDAKEHSVQAVWMLRFPERERNVGLKAEARFARRVQGS